MSLELFKVLFFELALLIQDQMKARSSHTIGVVLQWRGPEIGEDEREDESLPN